MTIRITSSVITPTLDVEAEAAAAAAAVETILLRYKIGSLNDNAALER
jgi:hypothetical protein